MSSPDQNTRLRVAAHIKAIADSDKTFNSSLAEEISALLTPMPIQNSRFSFRSSSPGRGAQGLAEGGQTIRMPGDEKKTSWSIGEKSFRCGAYVIAKHNDREFEIRHVMDIDAEMEEGELMLLRFNMTRWEALLNVPRAFTIGPLTLILGHSFRPWKTGV